MAQTRNWELVAVTLTSARGLSTAPCFADCRVVHLAIGLVAAPPARVAHDVDVGRKAVEHPADVLKVAFLCTDDLKDGTAGSY